MSNELPLLTDHALVRYLECVMGLDLSAIRNEILSPTNLTRIRAIRTGRIPIGDWTDLVVVDGRVTNVAVRRHQVPNARKKKRR